MGVNLSLDKQTFTLNCSEDFWALKNLELLGGAALVIEVIAMLVEELKEEIGVADCKIKINYSNGDILSANISVVAGDNENNIAESDIMDYVFRSLGISTENIECPMIKVIWYSNRGKVRHQIILQYGLFQFSVIR